MNSKNKFVFESFQDFVEQVLEKVKTGQLNEEEGTESLTSEANRIIGDLKLQGEGEKMATEFFSELTKYLSGFPKEASDVKQSIREISEQIADMEDSFSKSSLNKTKSGWSREYVEGTYQYSYAGTVLAKDFPYFDGSSTFISEESDIKAVNLFALLGAINLYNLDTLIRRLGGGLNTEKYKVALPYGGVSAAGNTGGLTYYAISDLNVNTINVTESGDPAFKFAVDTVDEKAGEISFPCPLYSLAIFQPGKGKPILEEMVEEIIKPAGTSVEVVNKKHSSEGEDFFAENEVKISEAGMKALKAMLSQYNKITSIKVNGAASSKPTSREGGNEQLAKDRRKAGIDALKGLQKTTPQLKDINFSLGPDNPDSVYGTAEVQQGPKEESDPKMQQVSFIISGTAKKSEIVNNEEVKITRIEKIMGDNIRLWQNVLKISVNGWGKKPNA